MPHKPILIGIAGGTASGKTSIATKLFECFNDSNMALITQDSYYKDLNQVPLDEHHLRNFDHPAAFDTELMIQQLSQALRGEPIEVPVYDYRVHARSSRRIRIDPKKILIIEGILVLEPPRLRELMDIKVFIDTDADIRFIRRLQRDIHERGRTIESVIEQYETIVRPMHVQFVEPSKRYADIIIPRGVENAVGVDVLMAKIKSLLHA